MSVVSVEIHAFDFKRIWAFFKQTLGVNMWLHVDNTRTRKKPAIRLLSKSLQNIGYLASNQVVGGSNPSGRAICAGISDAYQPAQTPTLFKLPIKRDSSDSFSGLRAFFKWLIGHSDAPTGPACDYAIDYEIKVLTATEGRVELRTSIELGLGAKWPAEYTLEKHFIGSHFQILADFSDLDDAMRLLRELKQYLPAD